MKRRDLFMPGDLSQNRFKIVKKLAKGGFAVAYLAHDQHQKNNKRVLKVSEIESNDDVKKIEAQYQLICSFNHPNIIKAYQYYKQQIQQIQYLFIIMEYAQEGDLKGLLGKLKEQDISKIYYQVKEVIQYIHARGVVHRDLTLQNILLDAKKNVKVIDFGIATKLIQQQTHVETNFLKGKGLHKPRQLAQQFIVSKQNDLWQFGITLIELVTGKQIRQLTKVMPYSIKNFPEQMFKKYKINKKFRAMIFSLLRNQYKDRKFCQDIFLVESSLYETTLQLVCPDYFLIDQTGKIIGLFNNLEKLVVSGNNLTDKFTYNIESVLASLMILKIAFSNIRDESMSLIIKKSLMLQQLDISYTLITSTSIMMLTKLTKLSSLAIWSGPDYPQRYEDIINNRNNQTKYEKNKIIINQQCVKQLCKINLTEICINADGRDIDELILRMGKQSRCIQVKGRMKSDAIKHICEMEKLQKVYLYNVNELKLTEFRSNELRSCALVYCKIDQNTIIKSLSKCNKLTSLNLRGNNIEDQGAMDIANNIKNLTSLHLDYNNIGKQGAIEIANYMKNLTSLHLDYNNIGNYGAMVIAQNLKRLISFHLMENNIDKQGAIWIAKNLNSLTSLYLRGNNIGKQGAMQIAKNMKSLTSLDLAGNDIGMKGAMEIAKIKSLTSLNLDYNNIGKEGAIYIAKNMKSLTFLHLGNNDIGKQGAIQIAKHMKSLTSLHLGNNNIGKGAIQIAKNMKSLTSIDLQYNYIEDQGAMEIANNMKNLTFLNLDYNDIGKQGAIQIANNMKNLTSFHLAGNDIGDQAAMEIVNNMKSLKCLDLRNNDLDNDTKQFIKIMLPTTQISI